MSALVLTSARALLLGVLFGVLYDAVRILKCLLCVAKYGDKRRFDKVYSMGVCDIFPRSPGGVVAYALTALFDVLYFVVVTVSFVLFLYAFNFGIFRWFILLACIAGFFAYHSSLGKIVIRSVDAASDLLRLFVNIFVFVCVLPFRYLYRFGVKMYEILLSRYVNKIRSRIDKRINRRYTLKCIKELDKFFVFQVEK